MSDDKFDAIVVGAGVAGTVAAYVMAKAGLDVLVIERGNSAGSKNMTVAGSTLTVSKVLCRDSQRPPPSNASLPVKKSPF